MKTAIRHAIFATLATLAVTGPAHAQDDVRYIESRSATGDPGTYFYGFFPDEQKRVGAIVMFDRPDDAAAVWIVQSINCETRQIATDRYAAYSADGALLQEGHMVPTAVARRIGADLWAERLSTFCDPPPPVMPIPVPVGRRSAPERAHVSSATEAIALMRARAEAARR